MNPSDSYHEGLALVLDTLTAQKRLYQRDASASPEVLRQLLLSKAPAKSAASVIPNISAVPVPHSLPVELLTSGTREERISALCAIALSCTKCPHLVANRTQVVFGTGNINAALMFVGEAPGEDEDLQGEPFVGKAGQLLTKMIQAMGLQRDEVYIANVLKCRPDMPAGKTGNRKPVASEMATCLPYLLEQIDIIRPRVIVALGSTAMEGLLNETRPMGQLRGHWMNFQNTPLMATYHPAYLLRNQAVSEKRKVWEDLLMVMEKLALPINDKQRGFFTR